MPRGHAGNAPRLSASHMRSLFKALCASVQVTCPTHRASPDPRALGKAWLNIKAKHTLQTMRALQLPARPPSSPPKKSSFCQSNPKASLVGGGLRMSGNMAGNESWRRAASICHTQKRRCVRNKTCRHACEDGKAVCQTLHTTKSDAVSKACQLPVNVTHGMRSQAAKQAHARSCT